MTRKATTMLLAALLAISFFHFHRHRPKPADPYVSAITVELQRVAAQVGDYQNNPPRFTSEKDDSLYVTRAELDLHIALATLHAYERGNATREDVSSAVSQLERDVEDEPVPVELHNS